MNQNGISVQSASDVSNYNYNAMSNPHLNDVPYIESFLNKIFGDNSLQYQRELETLGFQNAFNAEQARIARDWQKMMSDTAFQRQVKDMQAAGLNPYLAYGGSGAFTGSSFAAQSGHGSAPSTPSSNFLQGLISVAAQLALGMNSTATKMAIAAGKNNTAIEVARLHSRSPSLFRS